MGAGTGDLVGDATPTPATPFVIQVGGTLTSASAGQQLVIEQRGGDLDFERVFAGADARLSIPSGSLLQQAVGTGIVADSLDIDASAAVVGTPTMFVEIRLDPDGDLRVVAPAGVHMRSAADLNVELVDCDNGVVTLDVRGDAHIDQITAPNGIVSLFSDRRILDRRDAAVTPQPDGQSNIDANFAVLNARTGLGTETNPFETRLSRLEASSLFGDIWLQNFGDLEIGNVSPQVGVAQPGRLLVSDHSRRFGQCSNKTD